MWQGEILLVLRLMRQCFVAMYLYCNWFTMLQV